MSNISEQMKALADRLDQMAHTRQAWADNPEIGGRKPPLEAHLRGKRYGYSHAAQLIRAALDEAARAPAEQEGVLPDPKLRDQQTERESSREAKS